MTTKAEKRRRYWNVAVSADRFADLLYTIGLVDHFSYYSVYSFINNAKTLRQKVGLK